MTTLSSEPLCGFVGGGLSSGSGQLAWVRPRSVLGLEVWD